MRSRCEDVLGEGGLSEVGGLGGGSSSQGCKLRTGCCRCPSHWCIVDWINLEGARQQIYSAGQCFHCTVVTNCSKQLSCISVQWCLGTVCLVLLLGTVFRTV